MDYIDLNNLLAESFEKHGIKVRRDPEFIYPDLTVNIKLKSRATHTIINGKVSAQLDVMVITPNGEQIVESFGDISNDLDTSLGRLLTYFKVSDLHPLLAAFGVEDKNTLTHVDVEEWRIEGMDWLVYMGNTIPKTDSTDPELRPPLQFYKALEAGIRSQKLTNDLHWFRAYYLQFNDAIHSKELLMDNEDIASTVPLFSDIPTLPNVNYYSCRNFVILRKARKGSTISKFLKLFKAN